MDPDLLETYVGASGGHFVDLLHSHPDLLEETNAWLTKLGIAYSLHIKRDETLGELRLMLHAIQDAGISPLEVPLPQVGYGISQLLPIIVQSLLGRSQTILVEQPELHIHPRLQAEVGDLFAATSRGPQENRYIVESHSETLALRLQRRIREGKLKADDVSVVYVDPGQNGATIVRLRLDEYGNFVDEWPGGFFEENFNELFGGGRR
jgi:predicted ATPase